MPELKAQPTSLILSQSSSAPGVSGEWPFDFRSLEQLDPKQDPYRALTVELPSAYPNAFVSLGLSHVPDEDLTLDARAYSNALSSAVTGSYLLDANVLLHSIYSKLVSAFDLASASGALESGSEAVEVDSAGQINPSLHDLTSGYIHGANPSLLESSGKSVYFRGLGRALYTTWGALPCAIVGPSWITPPNCLDEHYASRDWRRVKSFLRANSFLEKTLTEALPQIEKYFGLRTKVILEVVEEPEAPGYEELFGFIQTEMDPAQALQILDTFDQDWWLDQAKFAKGRLNFALRYL